MKKLYLTVISTGLITGELVKAFARKCDYSHIAFSLSDKLNPLYSFGRLYWFSPFPGGFISEGHGTKLYNNCKKAKMRLFEIDITDEQEQLIIQRLAPFVSSPRSYSYNYLNIITHLLKKPCKLKKQFICTSFVGEIVGDIIGITKDPSLLIPLDFANMNHKIIYEGDFNSYKPINNQPTLERS